MVEPTTATIEGALFFFFFLEVNRESLARVTLLFPFLGLERFRVVNVRDTKNPQWNGKS